MGRRDLLDEIMHPLRSLAATRVVEPFVVQVCGHAILRIDCVSEDALSVVNAPFLPLRATRRCAGSATRLGAVLD